MFTKTFKIYDPGFFNLTLAATTLLLPFCKHECKAKFARPFRMDESEAGFYGNSMGRAPGVRQNLDAKKFEARERKHRACWVLRGWQILPYEQGLALLGDLKNVRPVLLPNRIAADEVNNKKPNSNSSAGTKDAMLLKLKLQCHAPITPNPM